MDRKMKKSLEKVWISLLVCITLFFGQFDHTFGMVQAAKKGVCLSEKKISLAEGDLITIKLLNAKQWNISSAASTKKACRVVKKKKKTVDVLAVSAGTTEIKVKIKNISTKKVRTLTCAVTVKNVHLSKTKVQVEKGRSVKIQLLDRGKWKISSADSQDLKVCQVTKRMEHAVLLKGIAAGNTTVQVKIKNTSTGKMKKWKVMIMVKETGDTTSSPTVTEAVRTDGPVATEAVRTDGPAATEAAGTSGPVELKTSAPEPMVSLAPSIEPMATEEPVTDFETVTEGVSKMTAGWNIGNALDSNSPGFSGTIAEWETSWGSAVITKELIHEIKKAGFHAIRIPVSWTGHLGKDELVDQAWMDRVEEVVNYCLDEDMYVIINVHHDTGNSEAAWLRADLKNYDVISVKFKKLWGQIAERFKDYGEKLYFEGYNELLDGASHWTSTDADGYSAQNRLAQLFVNTVRETGGNNAVRNLIVNTYSADAHETTVSNFIVPTDTVRNHLAVEVHCYMPDTFTMIGEWLPRNDTEFTEDSQKEIDQTLERLDHYFISKGIPVIVGEYGAQNKNNSKERAKYAYYFAYHAKQYGIASFWWDDHGTFSLIDRKDIIWSYPEIRDAIIAGSTLQDGFAVD